MHTADMIIGKTPFFLILFFLIAVPMITPRLIWLARSRTAVGVMGFEGRGTAGEQIQLTYSYFYFQPGKERIWFTAPPGLDYKEGDSVPVRYLPAEVTNARVDCLIGLWGDILVYGGIPELIVLIAFFHPEVVPRGSGLLLTLKSPYIRLWSIHPN
jgi:hypothetical protein